MSKQGKGSWPDSLIQTPEQKGLKGGRRKHGRKKEDEIERNSDNVENSLVVFLCN